MCPTFANIDTPLNEDGNKDIVLGDLGSSESRSDFVYCGRIRVEEVVGARRKMSRGRATGPGEIPVEFWKSVGRAGLEWLTKLFNVIFRKKRCSKSGDGARWFLCTRIRVISKIATTIGVLSCLVIL